MNASNPIHYRWRLLRAGTIRLDGGGMFGIIPRPLWTHLMTPDDQGRIELSHNCLLLERVEFSPSPGTPDFGELSRAGEGRSGGRILIESGSGNKLDPKTKAIFGLTDRTVLEALAETGCEPGQIEHAILTHLHFDHAGGLTHRPDPKKEAIFLSFPGATIHVQKREWEDAQINRSTMTRTYLPENLHPIRDRLRFLDSPPPFEAGYLPRRDELPRNSVAQRSREVLPGIFAFVTPGHTWGQQSIGFVDDKGRTIVFTPDVMPTIHHVGATYNLSYDVEPFISTVTRHWFLAEAAKNDWVILPNHEPGPALWRVREDGKGWFHLIAEQEGP